MPVFLFASLAGLDLGIKVFGVAKGTAALVGIAKMAGITAVASSIVAAGMIYNVSRDVALHIKYRERKTA
jgi:hypothetical protein